MAENSKNLTNKSKKKSLDLFISIFLTIVLLIFGIIIYNSYTKAKLSSDHETHTNRGFALANIGKYKESVKYLNMDKNPSPKIPHIYNNLGVQLTNQENITEAIVNFKKAIDINPKFYRAYTNLSATYFRIKDYESVKKYINLAIQNGANDSPIFKELLKQQLTELSKLENTTTTLP